MSVLVSELIILECLWNLIHTVLTVAAAGWSHAQVAGVCDTTLAYHDIQFNNASIAFL
jgi:hypothetical protein